MGGGMGGGEGVKVMRERVKGGWEDGMRERNESVCESVCERSCVVE